MTVRIRNRAVLIVAPFFVSLLAGQVSSGTGPEPIWAYGTEDASSKPSATQGTSTSAVRPIADASLKHLPGSTGAFSLAQIGDRFGPADWFPGDHPAMPAVVAKGRKPGVWACALCHYPNGKGRPENAGVAGLPVSYFVHQMNDFRQGLRKSFDTRKANTNLMIAYAKTMTQEEVQAAAEYFGAMKWTPWIKVVETDTVPKTRLSVGMYLPLEGNEKESLGQRIIEMPVQPEATEALRDPRSGFVAYVPFGSVKRGKALATAQTGKTVPCVICHGSDLRGMGPVPGLAGRSPSYLVRQLYDMQQNTRKGEWTELMKPVVEKLTPEDMLNLAAYLSSQTP